jgi:catalase
VKDDVVPDGGASGQPDVADTPDAVRGLGLQFSLPDGELWRTAMINLPVFPVRTPEAFYEMLIASKRDPRTSKPDPAKMEAFLTRHPETVKALTVIKGQPTSSRHYRSETQLPHRDSFVSHILKLSGK